MISIIVPTFGDLKRVSTLLSSIDGYESRNKYELIIVNDNPNISLPSLSGFGKIINNEKNLGFAASVNKGLAVTKGDILLLLNDDIQITSPFIDKLEEYFKDPELGIAGALLTYPGGALQHGGIVFNETLNSFLHIKDYRKVKTEYCIAVTGAYFAISRKLYNEIGGLDERFFLACEDTKYCLDAWDKGYKVKFFKELTAIHEEGATRGNTKFKKREKPHWTEAESNGIKEFKSTLDLLKIKQIEKKLRKLNGTQLKIEVGSGHNPQPGYLHLDVRKGLPELHYVCDFVKQKLPFKDGTVSEILANHVIEHIPFRKLPFVLSEWARVLEDGGRLVLRTPNLRFICEQYLKGEITPEWPGDEKFITDNLSHEVTPAWWANLKLFSGQDYDANFHHVCFDVEMLRDLLGRYGFSSGGTIDLGKVYSPGELQFEAFKAATKKTCLLIREGALGDVILTTPIVERLHKEGYDVYVDTKCREVFTYNPYVKRGKLDKYDKTVNLDLAYEKNPKMHIIDAYSLVAFGDTKTPHKTDLYLPDKKEAEDYIVVHAGKSWKNRTWSEIYWIDLIGSLTKELNQVVIVGAGDDFVFDNYKGVRNLVNKLTFLELCITIQNAKLFIGMDSGPLHIAQSVGTPAIGIFTCANPKYRTTSPLTKAIVPDLPCAGCLHEEPPPVIYCGCKRGDFKCLGVITPEKVLEEYDYFNYANRL